MPTLKDRWRSLPKRRRRTIQVLGAALLGAGVGALCPLLPEGWHGLCHLAAKLLPGVF